MTVYTAPGSRPIPIVDVKISEIGGVSRSRKPKPSMVGAVEHGTRDVADG